MTDTNTLSEKLLGDSPLLEQEHHHDSDDKRDAAAAKQAFEQRVAAAAVAAGTDDSNLNTTAPLLIPNEQVLVDEALNRAQQQQQEHEHEHPNNNETVAVVNTAMTSDVTVGEKQPDGFRDVFAAILFVLHLVAILWYAIGHGFNHLNYTFQSYNSTTTVHFAGLLWVCLISSLVALALSAVALRLMTHFAEVLIQFGLAFTVAFNLLLAVFFLTQAYWMGVALALLCAAFASCYAAAVWRRVAFAASNLVTALTAIRTNGGVVFAAFGIAFCVQLYTVVWLAAWIGVFVATADCSGFDEIDDSDDNNDNQNEPHTGCTSHMNGLVVVLFLLSYYWTAQVGKNLLHVTVSGVVGTYCFCPDDASHFLSPAIFDSLARACTWSFGSICLGSLFTAALQVLHALCHQARRRQGRLGGSAGGAMLLCVLECICSFLERLVAYFNKWAFCYIGLYGYNYIQAGSKVVQLFRDRGWTTLIADQLVTRTLALLSLGVGLGTGATGLLLAQLVPQWLQAFSTGTGLMVAFLFSALIGTALSYILFLSVVGAAVDTVIVVFAEAPVVLERNHPGLHRQMVTAWRQVYPDEFRL